MMAIAGIWFAYDWTMNNVPVLLQQYSQADISKLVRETNQLPDINDLRAQLSARNIFTHNVQAMLGILLAGLVSFSVLGMLVYLANICVVGGLLGVLQIAGMSPVLILLAGLLPHGIFEIPALMLSAASVLRIGAVLVTPQLGKSMGDVLVDLLADWTKVFIGLVIPLLAAAALVETYITPAILLSVLK
jgi:stage II sporulation protein M